MEGTTAEIQKYKKEIVHALFKGGTFNHETEYEAFSAQIEEERKLRGDMLWANLPPTEPNNVSLAYLVQNKDTPGKFDIEKAKALNIPKGKLYAHLKAGQDVEFTIVDKEGNEVVKKVRSEDVLGEPKPGRSVLILDLPSVEYVGSVLVDEKLNSTVVKNVDVVVHMLADDVATDEKYVNWMQSFSKSTKVRNLWTH
jgi:ribonuclease BN (tRNA processing enzyme)